MTDRHLQVSYLHYRLQLQAHAIDESPLPNLKACPADPDRTVGWGSKLMNLQNQSKCYGKALHAGPERTPAASPFGEALGIAIAS